MISEDLSILFPLIMLSSVVVGGLLSRHYQSDLSLRSAEKLWLGVCAFTGAVLAARIPFLLPGIPGFQSIENSLLGGKTILLGMVGGYFGVEFAKFSIGVTVKTGDSFVVPVAVSIAIGRLGCFFGGCCYGTPTSLPWGICFPGVDVQHRHPTQIYEMLFHLTAAVVAAWFVRRQWCRRQVIKLYFLAYFAYRFGTEFIRPEPKVLWQLTAYQWTALILTPLFLWLWRRDARFVPEQGRPPDVCVDRDLSS